MQKNRITWAIGWVAGLLQLVSVIQALPAPGGKRQVTVADTILMTTLPESPYAASDSSASRFAQFSPDNTLFVVVTQKGKIKTNENEFSLLLFRAADVFHSPKPQVLLTMRSRSNRDAIKNVRWLDNESLIFLGEANDTAQVFEFNIHTRKLKRWTHHATPLVDFDFNRQRGEVIYVAVPGPPDEQAVAQKINHGYAITIDALDDVPRSALDFHQPSLLQGEEIFVQHRGAKGVRIPFTDRFLPFKPIVLGPGGRYGVFAVLLRDVPPGWIEYKDDLIHAEVQAFRRKGRNSLLMRYMLLDIEARTARPILPGPVAWSAGGMAWSPDGSRVVLSGVFLPLDVTDPAERAARQDHHFVVDVDLASGEFAKITNQDFVVSRWDPEQNRVELRGAARGNSDARLAYVKTPKGWTLEKEGSPEQGTAGDLEISLEQDLNTPPKLYARDAQHPNKILLLDLNPQFAELGFGRVEAIRWKAADGHQVEGGLYLPPDYQTGRRYPVVLQTHGFSKNEFWISGPWNSAYAAQPLAAHGIAVLQIGGATEPGADRKYLRTVEEAPRQMDVYEGAIDELDRRGLVDKERVGILGFSRTVYHAEYALTHSRYPFAAATLVDGFDAGYFQYLIVPFSESDEVMVNGGPPFGTTLAKWLERSPSFNLDRVRAPVRLESYGVGGVLGNWEWFSALTHLGRPVDLIYLPNGTHLLVKPWERLASQQGTVDWYCFWLKGEEDPAPEKREQYERWREMRALQAKDSPAARPH